MKIKVKYLFLGLLFFFISSCKSLEEEGIELYEQGLYQEALYKFEAATTRDPGNVEAKSWVQKTRTKIIDKGLLEVRFLRMGKNLKAATEKLETLLRKQEIWHISYTSALTSSQEKEVKEANAYLEEIIKEAQAKETPTYIKWIELQFERTIAAGESKNFLQSINADLKRKAEKKYLSLVSKLTKKSFFSKDVVEAYASLWRIKTKPVKLDKNDPSRFSELTITQKINNKNPKKIKLTSLNRELKNTFSNSLFYHPYSKKKLALKLTGETSYHKFHYLESRTAFYREPYTEYEYVEKVTHNPIVLGDRVYTDPAPVREMEMVPVTRYRTEKFPYQVLIYNEDYTINLNGKYTNHQFATDISLSMNPKNTTEAHDISMPKASVEPAVPRFLNPREVEHEAVQNFSRKLRNQLHMAWEKRYCHSHGLSAQEKEESLHRCTLVKPLNQEVNSWYKKNFGVNHATFQELIAHNQK